MSARGLSFDDADNNSSVLLDNYGGNSSSTLVGNDAREEMEQQQQQQQQENNSKSFLGNQDDDDGFYDSLFYEDIESRLWENDSSYLIAVSPKIFENSRIRMKVILGYRVQSVVHALPSPNSSMDGSAVAGHLLPYDRYNRRRLYQSYYNRDRIERMSPEEFNQLPEYQQRRILKERFLNKRMEQRRGLKDSLSENMYGPNTNMNGSTSSLGNFMYWATRNLDQLGWKSLLGVVAFVFGLYRTVSP